MRALTDGWMICHDRSVHTHAHMYPSPRPPQTTNPTNTNTNMNNKRNHPTHIHQYQLIQHQHQLELQTGGKHRPGEAHREAQGVRTCISHTRALVVIFWGGDGGMCICMCMCMCVGSAPGSARGTHRFTHIHVHLFLLYVYPLSQTHCRMSDVQRQANAASPQHVKFIRHTNTH